MRIRKIYVIQIMMSVIFVSMFGLLFSPAAAKGTNDDSVRMSNVSGSANAEQKAAGTPQEPGKPKAKPGKASVKKFKLSPDKFVVNTEDDTAVLIYGKPGAEPTDNHLAYGNVIESSKLLKGWAEIEYQKYDWQSRKEIKATGYVNKIYLHPEPLYTALENKYVVVKPEIIVRLLPDELSRKTIQLFQGEVVDAAGETDVEGSKWIKVKFDSEGDKFDLANYAYIAQRNRFGWINSSDVSMLEQGKLEESSLSIDEIPAKVRGSEKKEWNQSEKETLAKAGFYAELIPPPNYVNIDDMVDAYHSLKSAKFITSDLFIHAWYLIFDRMVQDVEENKLLPAVKELTMKFIMVTQDDIKKCDEMAYKNTKVYDALMQNLIFFSTAMKLFEPSYLVDKEVKDEVKAIISRVNNAKEEPLPTLKYAKTVSEILKGEDFSQYVVRGHYEKNENMKRYFRGMMWYGRKTFYIEKPDITLGAILIARILEQDPAVMEKHKKINSILDVLIGRLDKWSFQDAIGIMKEIYPASDWQDINKFNDEGKLKKFQEKAKNSLPMPKIVSISTGAMDQEDRLKVVRGFKFIGQRFNWDAYFLNNVCMGGGRMPSAIEVMNILGSDAAIKLNDEETKKDQGLETMIENLKKEYESKILTDKTQWVYAGWLDTLNSFFTPTQSKQVFANSNPWKYKNLNTSLGSWSELKYSTILYTEQSYAEAGEGEGTLAPPYQPPQPRGYVEPNLVFWTRLGELVQQTKAKLEETNYLTDKYKDRLISFHNLVSETKAIAEKEVKGEPLTAEDYTWIDTMTNRLDHSMILGISSEQTAAASVQSSQDLVKMAIIADVHTDAVRGLVLLEATGVPMRMFVVVKDASGGTRITQGYIYTWYEFADKKRWQASEWKLVVYDEKNQSVLLKYQPKWYKEFVK